MSSIASLFRKLRFGLTAAGLLWLIPGLAAEPDPAVMSYELPDHIEWSEGSRASTAVLVGDPSEPGLYVVLTKWHPGNMSRPHFHPNDRFITVISGTWWVGSGEVFDPDSTFAIPAGSFVTHHANEIHYDGAKGEEVVLQIVGIGPATATSAGQR